VCFGQTETEIDTTKAIAKRKISFFSTKDQEPVRGKLYLLALPVVASNPTSGVLGGVAATGAIYLGDPKTTALSSASTGLTYSTNKQLVFTLKSSLYLKDNKIILYGDYRYLNTSQPTYGLGSGPQENKGIYNGLVVDGILVSNSIRKEQMLFYEWARFYQSAFFRIKPKFYAGAGFHLDHYWNINDQELKLDTSNGKTPTITSHYGYSIFNEFDPRKYTQSGWSVNLLLDQRDNQLRPTEGIYAYASFRHLSPTWGSTHRASQLWLEFRDYFGMSKVNPAHLIGVWFYGSYTTSGRTPYLNLPAVGLDQFSRSGRAYTQGRFRGEHFAYTEVEYRFPIQIIKKQPELLGGVVFANFSTAAASMNDIRLFQYIDPAVGAGLRIMINKRTKSNITIDYAIGVYGEDGFYLNINESF
jgi:hypothetical protein